MSLRNIVKKIFSRKPKDEPNGKGGKNIKIVAQPGIIGAFKGR